MKSIPSADSDFNLQQSIIVGDAKANAENWKLDVDWLNTKLVPAHEKWEAAWLEYQPSATRTKVITFTKNEARDEYEPLLRQLVKNLQANVRVTDDDLKRMGIAIPRSERTPIPVPATYPVFTVDSSVIRRLTIQFRDNTKTTSAKPHGVHGVEIKWGVGTPPQAGPTSFPNSSFDTRSPFTLEFTDEDRGKTVYFCLRWENTTGEKGPWGEVGTAIIP